MLESTEPSRNIICQSTFLTSLKKQLEKTGLDSIFFCNLASDRFIPQEPTQVRKVLLGILCLLMLILRTIVETVKVPQMAESISEGTLKQWLKKTGDFVKVDEEVATIETDKIDVSVNAPKSGKIVEMLANEEDTVSVGQDLFKLEPGEGPGEDAASKPISENQSHSESEVTSGAKDENQEKSTAEATPDRQPTSKKWSDVEVENKEHQPRRSEPQLTESKLPLGRTDFDGKSLSDPHSSRPALFDRTERRVKSRTFLSNIFPTMPFLIIYMCSPPTIKKTG
jgi:hypothetical protein